MNSEEFELNIEKKRNEQRKFFTLFRCLVNDGIDDLVKLKNEESAIKEAALADKYERQIHWLLLAVKELANYLEEDVRNVPAILSLMSEFPDFKLYEDF